MGREGKGRGVGVGNRCGEQVWWVEGGWPARIVEAAMKTLQCTLLHFRIVERKRKKRKKYD